MLAGRTLQELSMGFVPVGISLIRDVVPPGRTGTATAAVSAHPRGGRLDRPSLAAWIADSYDFHALFWSSTVLTVLAALPVAPLIPRVPAARRARLDLVGAAGHRRRSRGRPGRSPRAVSGVGTPRARGRASSSASSHW
ncbi:MFS transporter [Nocardioides sp. cx-169]|uniref:MFS transporter n=1 Tax=Nocardioides sp. cx-169 TaxID=2899080 RepID=UPI001E57B3A8|nr:MFS transporter [Nocardioides sp. cx-169]MCD4533789.1 MFS transporter [Nocardioides sp. cx-169]